MKPRLAALSVCVAALVLAACGERPPPGYPGYVEAEYVRVAAPLPGALARLDVKRGDQVARDAPLFALESGEERAARAEAQARLAKAEATLADLEKARRPAEVASVRAQVAQAEAALKLSEAELVRTQKLVADRFLPPQKLDEATSQRDRDRGRLEEARAQLAIANLPSRSDAIAAAGAEVRAAADAVAQAQWRLDQKTQGAPAAGLVNDTLYRPGEWVAAGAPVVSILPPGNVKVRFYVPEPALAGFAPGTRVDVHCDGCGAPIAATVSFVAPQAEYTPPVIYSRENRAKLVFLAEARADAPVPALRPGLPVEVHPAAASR